MTNIQNNQNNNAVINNAKEVTTMTISAVSRVIRRVSISTVIVLMTFAAITLLFVGVGTSAMPTGDITVQEAQVASVRTEVDKMAYERANNDRAFWAVHTAEQCEYFVMTQKENELHAKAIRMRADGLDYNDASFCAVVDAMNAQARACHEFARNFAARVYGDADIADNHASDRRASITFSF